MANIYKSSEELIGNTPLLELTNIEKKYGLKSKLFAKLEFFNPAGSAKDRVAKSILDDAEEKGLIKPGATIIEPTSGNTGIGLAAVAPLRGYRVIIVMPDTMSVERQKLIKAYGAELVLTDGTKGMAGAISKAEELNKEIDNSFIAGQFVNKANSLAHYKTTGPEIYSDLDGMVDIFVAGIGTGGTITGVGEYLKEKKPDVKVIGVEPASSPFITKGVAGSHAIQGIGAGFIPEVLDLDILDEVITIENDESYDYARLCGKSEGVLIGISAGAALCAAIKVALREENENKNIVVVFTDSGDRYLSTTLYE